jgi:hypothetical protein
MNNSIYRHELTEPYICKIYSKISVSWIWVILNTLLMSKMVATLSNIR